MGGRGRKGRRKKEEAAYVKIYKKNGARGKKWTSCSKEYKHKGKVSYGVSFFVCSINKIQYLKVTIKGRQQERVDGVWSGAMKVKR